ncbi:hypothetical protein TIFTF001_017055, partial [Ficus carica]
MFLGGEKASHLHFFLPSFHPPPNPSSTPVPIAGHPSYSSSINAQKSLLKQYIGARDVGVMPFAFDAAAIFVTADGHVTAAIPTSKVRIKIIEDSREDEGDEEDCRENSSDEEVDKEDHEVSRTVLTSELRDSPPLILSEYFSAKVIVRLRMTILADVHKWLTEEDKTVFRKYHQLGHLIDLPIRGEFSCALAHNLLLRKTVCGGLPKDEIKAQEEKNELKWPRKKRVLLEDVAKKLKELSVKNVRTKDRIWAFEVMLKLCEMMAKKL